MHLVNTTLSGILTLWAMVAAWMLPCLLVALACGSAWPAAAKACLLLAAGFATVAAFYSSSIMADTMLDPKRS